MTYEDLFDLIYSTRISESLKNTTLSQYSCPIEEAVEEVNPYIELLDTLVNSSISEELLYSIIDETFSTLDEEVINEVSDQWIKGKVDNAVKKAHAGTKDAVGLNAFRNYDKTMDRAETVMNKAANRPTYSNPQPKQASPKSQTTSNTDTQSTSNTEKKEGLLGKLKSAVGKVFNKTRAEKDLRPKDIQPHLAKLDVQDKPETVGKAPKAKKVKPASPKAEKTQKVEKVKPATTKKDKNVKNASGKVKTTTASKPEEPPVPVETPVVNTGKKGSKAKVTEEPAPAPTEAPVAKKGKKTTTSASKKLAEVKAAREAARKAAQEERTRKAEAKAAERAKKAEERAKKAEEKEAERARKAEEKEAERARKAEEKAKKAEVKAAKKAQKTTSSKTNKKEEVKKEEPVPAETPKVEAKKEEAPKTEVKTAEEKKPKVYIKPGQLSTPNNGKTTGSYKKLGDQIDQEIKKGEKQAARKTSDSKLSNKDKYAAEVRRMQRNKRKNFEQAIKNAEQRRASIISQPNYSSKEVEGIDNTIANLKKELASLTNESLADALYLIATTNISESAYVQIAELLAASNKNIEKVKKAREQAVFDAVDKMENDILTHRMNKETAKNAEDAEKKRERFEELYRKRFKNN